MVVATAVGLSEGVASGAGTCCIRDCDSAGVEDRELEALE